MSAQKYCIIFLILQSLKPLFILPLIPIFIVYASLDPNSLGQLKKTIEISEVKNEISKRPGGINGLNYCSGTLLHEAISGDNFRKVSILIDLGADLNTPDICGDAPLHYAVFKKRNKITQLLVESKADLDIGSGKRTPLHIAIEKNDTQIAQLLINSKADLNIQDVFGNTPLHNVISTGNTEITQLLTDSNANLNIQNKDGNTPLDLAIQLNNTAIIQLLTNQNE